MGCRCEAEHRVLGGNASRKDLMDRHRPVTEASRLTGCGALIDSGPDSTVKDTVVESARAGLARVATRADITNTATPVRTIPLR